MKRLLLILLLLPAYSYAENNMLCRDGQAEDFVFNNESKTISQTSVLDNASGDEIAYSLSYETNKAAGNDTGLFINQIDTNSPGSSLLADLRSGGVTKFNVDNTGKITVADGLYFGDGDTGFYETSDDLIYMLNAGAPRFQFGFSYLGSIANGGGLIGYSAASATIPGFTFLSDTDTGVGRAGADQVSLIAGGVEAVRATSTGTILGAIQLQNSYISNDGGSEGVSIDNNGVVSTTGHVNTGKQVLNVTNVNSATYDVTETDSILNVSYTTTGAVTSLTLTTASCTNGRVLHIKDAGLNAEQYNITIDTEGGELIDGAATRVITTDNTSLTLYCYGSNWYIF